MAENYLKHFTRQAWHVLEPTTAFVSGWHIDVICEHLEAVSRSEITRLLINIPPRHTKSLLVSVLWPCWSWIHNPSSRWLFVSYGQDLSTRDSVKCRRLITSQWYQEMWGDKFAITSDQNQKTRFENNKTGYRLATSVGGMLTGEGGGFLIIDDPHNVKEAESDTIRESILRWYDEVLSTRLDDPKTGAKVIIMQRVHERDLSGHVLQKEAGYTHLCLPARYETDRRCTTVLGFSDPRKEEGKPLWPALYGDKELTELENSLGSYAAAGQLQQRPSPRGGGMFKIDKFELIDRFNPDQVLRSVRYWDKAGTQGGGAFTAGVLIHRMRDKSYVVADVVHGQWSSGTREQRIKQVAELDGSKVRIWVEQEPGSGGKESAESTIRNLTGYTARADRVTGSKEVRAEPYAAQVEIGNVSILNRQWTKVFLQEHESFPVGKRKDQVDAAAGALVKLSTPQPRAGVWGVEYAAVGF
ncbi:MAG: phage terminase large subunit [Candidatus Bathyarchaeia archaeon]